MVNKYNSRMVDIETLACTPDAKVLSISAVAFNRGDMSDMSQAPTFHVLLALEGQENRFEDGSTVLWWSSQPEAVQEALFTDNGRTPLMRGLQEFRTFMFGATEVWANRNFHLTILENLLRENNMRCPWNVNQCMDFQTVAKLTNYPTPPTNHDGLEDCMVQVMLLEEMLATLGIPSAE